eukprot:TRINITY_DN22730_c0_g1_i1.p1 TRINITY_DN22730_c0_g1~~TRINITY_DN22730_c0_g1_i1.p1  ORF type:complete len:609 (+),score=91.25 TRINITY_DN22730_c0_g1_i1:34-1860(+)
MAARWVAKPWTIRGWFAAMVFVAIKFSVVSTRDDLLPGRVLRESRLRESVGASSSRGEGEVKQNRKGTEENEGDGQEEEEKEKEEEEVSLDAVYIAATLMLLITFQMLLFYMMNHKDDDMRRYTYEVISSTVSIFCAVLLFQSANALLTAMMGEVSEAVECIAHMVHMMFWYIVVQLALAHISGAIGEVTGRVVDYNDETANDKVKADMASFAVLLAHMTGFASIFAWGTLQQLSPFSSSPIMSLLIVPLALLGQCALQRVANMIRTKVAFGDDGEWDQAEIVWNEQTCEAEDDIMGLCCSWLLSQSFRFWIVGVLPNVEGADGMPTHSCGQTILLAIVGVGLSLFIGVVVALREAGKASEDVQEEDTVKGRFINSFICMLGMSMSWCVFFSSMWYMANIEYRLTTTGGEENPMVLTISTAFFASVVGFILIYALDKLADADWTPETVDAGIRRVIAFYGFAIGFAWEKCFDAATEVLSESLPSPRLSKLVLAVLCAAVVVPAWRWYVLPMSIQNGWKYGFVLDFKNTAQWKSVITNHRFQRVRDSFKDRQTFARSQTSNERKPSPREAQKAARLKREIACLEDQLSTLLNTFDNHLNATSGLLNTSA